MTMLKDQQLFKSVLDNLAEGVYLVDRNRTIVYWNRGAEKLSGFAKEEVVGRCCADNILMHIDGRGTCLCKAGCPLAATIQDGAPRHDRLFLHHKEGHRVPVRVSVAPVRDDTGAILGAVETFHDATVEMAALEQAREFERDALLCPLTGIGNRRYTERTLRRHFEEWSREGRIFAALFLDIDDFKAVNDRMGHCAGDIALKMVARTLANAMRGYDFVGRWGGEEFLALLPNTQVREAAATAERLRALIEHSTRCVTDHKLAVTVSAGVAGIRPGDTAGTLVKRANLLMHQSKRRGKNQVSTEAEASSATEAEASSATEATAPCPARRGMKFPSVHETRIPTPDATK